MAAEMKIYPASGLDYALSNGSVTAVIALMHGMHEGNLVPLRVDKFGRVGSLAEA